MSHAGGTGPGTTAETSITELLAEARNHAEASLAEATRRAYRADWAHFEQWCASRRLLPLPAAPQTIAAYITDLARIRKVSTIRRRLSAISAAHRLAGKDSPTLHPGLRKLLEGLKRTKGMAPDRKAPTLTPQIRQIVQALPPTLAGIRDRALLLIGFAGALRRSELVALDVEDVATCDEGLVLTIRRGKHDQRGYGRKVGIHRGKRSPTCPVRALGDWLDSAAITTGPIFRPVDRYDHAGHRRLSDRAVALIVKRHVGGLGLDPGRFSGHSLRAGLATSAIGVGVDPLDVRRHTGHASLEMLRRSIRDATVFRGNPTARIGL